MNYEHSFDSTKILHNCGDEHLKCKKCFKTVIKYYTPYYGAYERDIKNYLMQFASRHYNIYGEDALIIASDNVYRLQKEDDNYYGDKDDYFGYEIEIRSKLKDPSFSFEKDYIGNCYISDEEFLVKQIIK